MDLESLHEAIREQRVRVTDHADEAAVMDRLLLDDIYHSVHQGEIIENYPTDRPYPSCLIFGPAPNGDPVHTVWAYNELNE